MIGRQEVRDFSREFGLSQNVIEKDYVLGWVLAGIANHSVLGSEWVFKGGTCLKKCYFETYRFSEDLDFTVTTADNLNPDFLINIFQEISDWIYERTGIEIPKDTISFGVYSTSPGALSSQGKISYRGPLQRRDNLTRIKLDLTTDEIVALNPVSREVHHPYSDKPDDGINVQCYCFEELFAEKIRALEERLRPRDLYDVIHLYRHNKAVDRSLLMATLERKCEFKGIPTPTMELLENMPEKAELTGEWENMLGHQLPVLPPFEQFWSELPAVFEWIYRSIQKVTPLSMPSMGMPVDTTWQLPVMSQAWHTSTPLETIRYAAANRLCVDLMYDGSRRLIEPYSLRRTSDGNLLLYAVKHATGENRSYRVDRIQGVTVTSVPFTPRFAIELTAAGYVSVPAIKSRGPTLRSLTAKATKPTRSRSSKKSLSSGPKYVFRCSLCGKQLIHKSYNATIGEHKNKQGYSCFGRIGIYVTTKY